MSRKEDYLGVYTIVSWQPGEGLSEELFEKNRDLTVTSDGDRDCRLAWNDTHDQPRSLTLRWTPLFGGALYQSDVEVEGASTRLVEAGVQLDFTKRLLTGTLTTDVFTGEPGTFAAQATVPPDCEPG
jgi:hypothetical protein